MIHTCSSCNQRYLVSDYYNLCSWYGEQRQQQIERLHESDDALEWWRLACEAMCNEQTTQQPRWEVK